MISGERWAFFYKIRIDTPDDFIFIAGNKGKGVINVIRIISLLQDRLIIIAVLAYRCTFGRGVKEPAKDQEFGETIDIIFQFCKALIGREKRIEP